MLSFVVTKSYSRHSAFCVFLLTVCLICNLPVWAQTTVSYSSATSTYTIPDPTSYPTTLDSSADGVSATAAGSTVSGAAITAFNYITVTGLSDTFMGDLTATLTHAGVTVDLFDHIGGTSTDYNNSPGDGFYLSNADTYTFAATGSNYSAYGYHPATRSSPGYWDTVGSGTYAASGNAAGGADKADAGNTLNNFVGLSADGSWLLTIYQNAPNETPATSTSTNPGTFTGFLVNIAENDSTTPEPRTFGYIVYALELLAMAKLGESISKRKKHANL